MTIILSVVAAVRKQSSELTHTRHQIAQRQEKEGKRGMVEIWKEEPSALIPHCWASHWLMHSQAPAVSLISWCGLTSWRDQWAAIGLIIRLTCK